MERMAIRSFIAHGHAFHLYVYDEVDRVPEGTVVKDAREILPERDIFGYQEGFAKGSVAAFSNFFRYKLLCERGGWWVDTDVVCLRPFDFCDERLWATERADPPGELVVASSVIKAPLGDELMAWAWDACARMETGKIAFGDIGPRLLQAGVDALNLHRFLRPHTFFNPVPPHDWRRMLDPACQPTLGPEVYAVHLWNQMWSANGVDKDASFPTNCLYEQLKRRFLQS
jgi:hypothetical protein